MLKIERLFEAYLDGMDSIVVLLPHSYGVSSQFLLRKGKQEWQLQVIHVHNLPGFTKYECKVSAHIEIGTPYLVVDDQENETDLQIGAVIRTKEFDEAYYYDGDDLGVIYTEQESTFKVWSPPASLVKLRVYKEDGYIDYNMTRGESGVWSYRLPGDWEGARYTFVACINLVWREVTDPYAKAITVNGEHGVVINMERTRGRQTIDFPSLVNFTDAVIYEAHIRDLTIHPDSGVLQKGKYLGMIETQTMNTSGTTTGLSYLKELGITHLELLPFNHFGGVDEQNPKETYNWGYNPLHFNVPEGSYATNPADPYSRIMELKQMIEALHENGIGVIMDVVYNHVYIREESSFEKLVPGYYFRHDANGMPSNGTGVGNDIASERRMVRKFILDSVQYWLQEYRVDGFRFDLMGILDWETMNEVRRVVDAIRPDVLILGEGWDLNTPLPADKKATLGNAKYMPRIAHFNDRFRDYIKGSTFSIFDQGYAFGNCIHLDEVKRVIRGSVPLQMHDKALFDEPEQTVNYVESHDNHTMWDKLSQSNAGESEAMRKRRHLLATTITLLSQGIPFLHAGQEFYRTKQGIENSYNAPDHINQIDWTRKEKNSVAVEYVKGLIRLRRSHGAFRFASTHLIQKHCSFLPAPTPIILYHLHDVAAFGQWKEILVVFNTGVDQKMVKLPSEGEWQVLVNETESGIIPITCHKGEEFTVAPVSSYVLAKM